MTILEPAWATAQLLWTTYAGCVGALLIVASLPISRLAYLVPASPQGTLRNVFGIGLAVGWPGIFLCAVAVFTAGVPGPLALPALVAVLAATSVIVDGLIGRAARSA